MFKMKRINAGNYVACADSDITVYHSESGWWIAQGRGFDERFKTKREAVEYAEWIYDFKG